MNWFWIFIFSVCCSLGLSIMYAIVSYDLGFLENTKENRTIIKYLSLIFIVLVVSIFIFVR